MNALRNVLWGIRESVWGAAFCVALAGLAVWSDDSLTSADLLALVGFYVGMGLCAGTLLGVGRPLLASNVGRGVVGFLVALPVTFLALFAPPQGSGLSVSTGSVLAWLGLSAVLGPIGAAYLTIRNRQRGTTGSQRDA